LAPNGYPRSVRWWCVIVNEFTTTTAASMHVTAWHLTAWLNDGFAQCECWSGVKLQWMTYLVYSRRSSSLCVVPPPAVHAPTPARRPSGLYYWSMPRWLWLLMYGYLAWPAYKPTPKALSLKFSQKLLAYTRVYTVYIEHWTFTLRLTKRLRVLSTPAYKGLSTHTNWLGAVLSELRE